MGRAEGIQEQRRRLADHRATLAAVLRQIAMQGEAYAPPGTIHTRDHARAEIARVKAVLRGWGETVEDHPDDIAPTAPPLLDAAPTTHGPAASISQPNWQVQQVINTTGPVYMAPAAPPPPVPSYPSSPAPTTPIEALAQPFPFSTRPQVRSMLETYIEIFGGRAAELAQLDAFLHAATPYALLLAPTGRGKTALLIQWAIQVHARGGWQVIFVPISIRYQTAAADVVFRTLGLALATIHGEQAQFDGYRQTPEDLRAISADYLRRPLPEGQQVLLVLDGLDEAVGWELRAGLFPRMPPARLWVVCAARQVAHKTLNDWLRDLDWRKDLVWRVPLAGLDDAAVQDILVRMGNPLDDLATDVDFIKEIGRISAGDPLTIRMLIEALRDGDLQPKKLTAMTPGLAAFVQEWLADLEAKSAQHAGIRTLLGLCAVALGPLTSDDLATLAPEVFPHGAGLKQIAGAVARVLIGDGGATAGYVFSHPRLRELFGERVLLQHEREDIQARFVAYGERCYAAYRSDPQAQPIPTYLRQFWVAHLVAARAWAQVRVVLTEVVAVQTRTVQPWSAARYAAEGSYAGYLTDLDRLWGHAEQQQDLVLVIRCALIAASIRSLSGNLSSKLIVGLVTVGTSEGKWSFPAALEHIRQMPDEQMQAETIQALAENGVAMDMVALLAMVRGIGNERARAKALAGLAVHLPEDLVGEALNVAQGIGNERDRARALVGLAAYLPEDLVGEALNIAQGIEFERGRAEVLVAIAPYLPEGLVGEVLNIAQGIGNERDRAEVLAGIAPHLPKGLVSEALAAARGVGDEGARISALVSLAPHLLGGDQGTVWGEVLAMARGGSGSEGDRAKALVCLAPHLPKMLMSEALDVAWSIGNEWLRAEVLAGLAPHLPECLVGVALAAAQGMGVEWARAEALAGLAPYLPEGEQGAVWSEALAAARRIGSEWLRAKALAEIAPHLPEDMVSQALDVARRIRTERARVEALASFALHLSEGEQGAVWSEALAIVRREEDKWLRSQAMAGIAPHLSEGEQGAVWGEALAAARGIGDKGLRSQAMAEIAPHLSEGEQGAVWSEALVVARGIESEWARAEVLAGTAPHLPEWEQASVWGEVLAIWRGGEDGWAQSEALAGIVPHLPKDLVGEALVVARGIESEWARAEALAGIAPHLPEGEQRAVWGEALAVSRGGEDEWAQARALTGLAPHLPKDLVGEALIVAQAIEDERVRAEALAGLAPHLPDDLVGEALIVARGIRNEWAQAEALAGFAPHLPEDLVGEALIVARGIGNEGARVSALVGLAPHLPEGEQRAVWGEALAAARRIGAEGERAKALVGLASYLPEGEQGAVWGEALAAARRIGAEGERAKALVAITPYLPDRQVDEVLAVARGIRDAGERAKALVVIASYLPEGEQRAVWGEELAVARGIGDEEVRASVLAAIAPCLSEGLVSDVLAVARRISIKGARVKLLACLALQCVSYHFPRAILHPLLRPLAARGRPDLLSDLAALMPWIVALTTPEERVEIVCAMREVSACWP